MIIIKMMDVGKLFSRPTHHCSSLKSASCPAGDLDPSLELTGQGSGFALPGQDQ